MTSFIAITAPWARGAGAGRGSRYRLAWFPGFTRLRRGYEARVPNQGGEVGCSRPAGGRPRARLDRPHHPDHHHHHPDPSDPL